MQTVNTGTLTCRQPANSAKRAIRARPRCVIQHPRLSTAAVQQAVPEAAPAAAPADEAPALPLAHKTAPIPVIAAAGWLAPETNGAPPPRALADDIMAAAAEFGMFQIVDHGLSLELLANLREAQRAFFALPLAKKMRVHRTVLNPNGYYNADLLQKPLDHLEGFDFGSEAPPAEGATSVSVLSAPNQWPEGEDGFRAACEACYEECTRASFKLLAALSAGLGLAPHALHPLFEGHTSFLRLNHFPTASAKHDGVANHGHTDPGFLTILIQDGAQPQGGLQVHTGGAWQDVEPIPDALLIKLGDVAQVLTNDTLRAPAHRVLSPAKQPRFSAPFHFSPARQAVIEPLPQFTAADRPPVYQPVPWEAFRAQRYAGDFQGQRHWGKIHQYKL